MIKNNWSPSIEKELITELKSPIKKVKSPEQSQYKSFCLLIGVLGLLSIGLCVQADTITQNLRKIARVSVEQIIRINSQ
ncbi:hypothetical protein [Calothrix sp. CCY 0018]|uniref:hypothetical protein n=1 Tax=Calothrix sp. CCY 0018 TaxID=3103864 RepID=UPI0039C65641